MLHDGVVRDGVVLKADHPWADARLAQLYDVFPFDADLPFYLELARQQGPRVLELACGSGRVLAPLARAGFDVVGIDVSPHMLGASPRSASSSGRIAGRIAWKPTICCIGRVSRPKLSTVATGASRSFRSRG